MRYLTAALIAALCFCFSPGVAQADDILAAARKERARQEALRKKREAADKKRRARAPQGDESDKPLTSTDLRRRSGSLSVAGDSGSSDDSAKKDDKPTEATDAEPEEEKVDPRGDRQVWQDALANAQQNVAAAKEAVVEHRRLIQDLRRAESAIDDPNISRRKREERLQAESAMKSVEAAVTAAEKAVAALREDARRRGVPPGWLR